MLTFVMLLPPKFCYAKSRLTDSKSGFFIIGTEKEGPAGPAGRAGKLAQQATSNNKKKYK